MESSEIFNLLLRGVFVISTSLLRYFIVAGIFFWIFYVLKGKDWQFVKIQPKFPKNQLYWQEIKYSLLTMVIFACMGMFTYWLKIKGFTQVYDKVEDFGWVYFIISIPVMLVIHDTCFYWTHRAMHHPKLYRLFHKTHHLSHNPSPWAAFAFHPLEAVVEAGIAPLLLLILPLHFGAFFFFILIMMVMNVIGHLGFEIHPKGFQHHWFGKWHNSSTHHNMHHELVHYNYGLYFNWWDRWMNTNHALYFSRLEEVNQRREKAREEKLLQHTKLSA